MGFSNKYRHVCIGYLFYNCCNSTANIHGGRMKKNKLDKILDIGIVFFLVFWSIVVGVAFLDYLLLQ